MQDYKKMFCKKANSVMACTNSTIIESENTGVIFLSLMQLYNEASKDIVLQKYVRIRKYEMLKRNYQALSKEDLMELIEVLKMIYKALPSNHKDFFLDKANVILDKRGYHIDLYHGLNTEDGIAFFIDINRETQKYIRNIIKD